MKSLGKLVYAINSDCSHVKTLKLPNELHIIKKATFYGCYRLKSFTIPSTVEYIYSEAFSRCNALESIKALPENPPFLYDNSFSNYSVPLMVPKGCKEAYQNAQGWKNFTNISNSKYKLTYLVDGEEYKSYDIEYGEAITPEAEPTKETSSLVGARYQRLCPLMTLPLLEHSLSTAIS